MRWARKSILEISGILPEDLPAQESVKKIEKKEIKLYHLRYTKKEQYQIK